MHEPIVAGQFYESDPESLRSELRTCLEGAKQGKARGAISPHAGYVFSGRGTAKSICGLGAADTYVIFGVNHSGHGSGISIEDWKTPLGRIETDKRLARAIADETDLVIDESVHAFEHSIEVQLPFIRYLYPGAKIVAVTVSTDIDVTKVAQQIGPAVRDAKLIASSDFTHYGPDYGYMPFRTNIRENMRQLDMGAIEQIKNLDAHGFLEYVHRTGTTICGMHPIAVLLGIMQDTEVEMLDYYTSGDVMGDYSNSVGYASVLFHDK